MSMTRDDVMRLSGRALDEAVARDVLGLTWSPVAGPVPYSRDIDAAWEVVDRLRDLNWRVVVKTKGYMLWHCVLEADFPPYMEGAIAPTAPEAICRAALLSALKRSEAKNGGDGA